MKSKLKRALAFALLTVMLMAMSAPMAVAAAEARISADCTLYDGPGKTNKAIASLKKGDTVMLVENTSATWARVIYNKKEGFVERAKLEATGAEITVTVTAEPGITLKSTVLREKESASAKALLTIPKDKEVSVLDTSGATWYRVAYGAKEGYAAKADIQLGRVVTSDDKSSASSTAPTIVRTTDVNASKIEKAKKKNSDVVGWISVPNTNVDEPILYRSNFYYATHNIDKKKSSEGVYPHTNKLTKNVVLYGHNLRKGNKVFHQMHHLQEASLGYSRCQNSLCKRSFASGLENWYKTSSGRTWNISIFGKTRWEVWAMYEVPEKEPISTLRNNWNTSPSNMDSWIAGQLKKSELNFGVSVTSKDQILTIVTCGTNYDSKTANSRLFVFLKCVD